MSRLSILVIAGCGRIGFGTAGGDGGDLGLVMAFDFEGSLTDGVGGRTPTCANCATFAPGHTGSGLQFSGSECMSLIDEPAFRAPELTIALWVNLEPGGGNTVFAKSFDDDATSNNSWELWFPDDNTAQFSTVEQGANVYLTTSSVTLGAWRHYAGTLAAGAKRFYVDGVEVASEMPGGGTVYDDSRVRIGCDKDFGVEVGSFAGVIDDVRFYDRALAADEIEQLAR